MRPYPTGTQVNSTEHVLIIGFIIGGLIAVAGVIFLWRRASAAFFKGIRSS